MIHQCYFETARRERLFTSPLYQGFGLYASVNPDIARNCPELADPQTQPMLSEYAAMLHLWRNPDADPDPWIGFPSYRQLEKFPPVLSDRAALDASLTALKHWFGVSTKAVGNWCMAFRISQWNTVGLKRLLKQMASKANKAMRWNPLDLTPEQQAK